MIAAADILFREVQIADIENCFVCIRRHVSFAEHMQIIFYLLIILTCAAGCGERYVYETHYCHLLKALSLTAHRDSIYHEHQGFAGFSCKPFFFVRLLRYHYTKRSNRSKVMDSTKLAGVLFAPYSYSQQLRSSGESTNV